MYIAFAGLASGQDLKVRVLSPNDGFIYEKNKAVSIALEISNESSMVLGPYDSVLIRFRLDGLPLSVKVGNAIQTVFSDRPPYALGSGDSSFYVFHLPQAVLLINDTITGSRELCAEIELLSGADSNTSNNHSCINLLLTPGNDSSSGGEQYAAVLTPVGYSGNIQNFQLYVQGGLEAYRLKIARQGYGTCSFTPQLLSDSAAGKFLVGQLDLQYADTGKWDIVFMDGFDTIYVQPAAYEVRRRSLTAVRPGKLVNFGEDSFTVSGSGLPGINWGRDDTISSGVILLINGSDTIGPMSSFFKWPDAREWTVFYRFNRIEGGIYDLLLVLDGWDSLWLEKCITLDPPERVFDFSMNNYSFSAISQYTFGEAAMLSARVYYERSPGVPALNAGDSIAFHFTMNGLPLPVLFNGLEDSVHVFPGGASGKNYEFPGAYLLFDSSAQGNAEICINVKPLTVRDTLPHNNTACKTIFLLPASPDTIRPVIREVGYEDVYGSGIHSITISGEKLLRNSVIQLFKEGFPAVRAIDSMTRMEDPSRELKAYFDLTAVDTGWWDVIVSIPGGDTVVSRQSVYVKELEFVFARVDTMPQRGHKELRFRVNSRLHNDPDIQVICSNGLDSFYLDKLNISRSVHDTNGSFSGIIYPYLMPLGSYDLIVRMKGKDLLKKNAVVVQPRPHPDSIMVGWPFADRFYYMPSVLLTDEGSLLDVNFRRRSSVVPWLSFGDSLEFRVRVNNAGVLLTHEGIEDSVFRFRVDTSNAKIGSVRIDSIRFAAFLPDAGLDSLLMRDLCIEIRGLNFVDTVGLSERTYCRKLMLFAERPDSGPLRITNETIGNAGMSNIRIMGEENSRHNYNFTLQRPGSRPVSLRVGKTFIENNGAGYRVLVNTDGLPLGDWDLIAEARGVIIRKPVKVMESGIRQIGPGRFGIQSGAQFEWTVLIQTDFIDSGLHSAWLSGNGTGLLYADEIRKVVGHSDIYSIRFKSPPQNLIEGGYDLNVYVSDVLFTLKNAVSLEAPYEKELDVIISGPGEVRSGYWQPYMLQVTNASNVEVPGVIIPFATGYDSIRADGLSLLHVTSDSFNGAGMGNWRTGILTTGKLGPQETRIIRLKAVSHQALTEPVILQAGLFSIASTRDMASAICLSENLADWLGWPSGAIMPACLSSALQQQGDTGIRDFAATVTAALVTCGYNGDADSLRAVVTRLFVARGADRYADSCDARYRPISHYRVATEVLWSYDPNDKYGPNGAGPHNYFDTARKEIEYVIRFENDSSAKAAAQIVRIVDTLDKDLFNMSSFRLGDVWVADSVVMAAEGRSSFNHYRDFSLNGRPYVLHIRAALDTSAGVIEWILTTLDKKTMELTSYARGGFLPPNLIATEGQGSVSFSIRLKDDLPRDVSVRNRAYIYFDLNPPIITDEFENRIDDRAPSSSVMPLPAYVLDDSTVRLRWDGTDTGSGIWSYSVFVSENGGSFEEWLSTTNEKEGIFTGEFGSEYAFYSVATDGVGYRELPPAGHDAVTRFVRCADVLSLSIDTSGLVRFCRGDQVILRAGGGQYYEWNNGADGAVVYIRETGAYQVTVRDTFGCMLKSDTIFTTVFELPEVPGIRRSADTLYSDRMNGSQWYRNGVKIDGATDSYCVLSLPGSYQVAYTDSNGCTSFSEEVRVTDGTSVAASGRAGSGISVYPNPSEIFTVTGRSGGPELRVMVYDMQGKLIMEERKPVTGAEFLYRLDLSAYAPASYWLYVISGDAFYSGKLVRP